MISQATVGMDFLQSMAHKLMNARGQIIPIMVFPSFEEIRRQNVCLNENTRRVSFLSGVEGRGVLMKLGQTCRNSKQEGRCRRGEVCARGD